jgi:DNA-binding MarR family transcriptional regulator
MKATDFVDRMLEDWRREKPDLSDDSDGSAFEVIGRIMRIAAHLRVGIERELAAFGISWEGFDVLATLRRRGRPFAANPTALYRSVMLSSGAMTNRLDRLESAGLIRRAPDPADRRAILVQLTPKGRKLIESAIGVHAKNGARLVAGISARERRMLAGLLRELLLSLEALGHRMGTRSGQR